MRLRVVNQPFNVPLPLIKEAIKFYSERLLSTRLLKELSITVSFRKFEEKKDYAVCYPKDSYVRSKKFSILVNQDLHKRLMLQTLAHEMVHVKQYRKGELSEYMNHDKAKWLGKQINLDEVNYFEQPWEIEANGRELSLYYQFLNFLKEKK